MYHTDDNNEPGSPVAKKAKTEEEKEEHKEEDEVLKGWKISSALNFYCM